MAWTIDSAHSQVQFAVRHMMISNVRGRFEDFTGSVKFDGEDISTLSIDVVIDAASINTREAKRDAHLKSPDFLDVENYPNLTFTSRSVEKISDKSARVFGDLSIRGVVHRVALDVEYAGSITSPWGTRSAGFSAHTSINRKEWGLVWNQTLETGGLLVAEEIRIDIELELIESSVEESVEA